MPRVAGKHERPVVLHSMLADVQVHLRVPSPPVRPPPHSPPPPLLPHVPPPYSPGALSGISGNPHLKGAHGEEADFTGAHKSVYNALSARKFSLNLLVEHDTLRTPFSKLNVHCSWVRAAFHLIRTRHTGRVLQVFFHSIDPHKAVITEERNGFALISTLL